MNRELVISYISIAVMLLIGSCGDRCRDNGDIYKFFSSNGVDPKVYRMIKIEADDLSLTLSDPVEISQFASNLYNGYSEILNLRTPKDRSIRHEEIGKLVVYGNLESCYKLFRSTDDENLFAIRINDPSKGGGSLFWFSRFKVNEKELWPQ